MEDSIRSYEAGKGYSLRGVVATFRNLLANQKINILDLLLTCECL